MANLRRLFASNKQGASGKEAHGRLLDITYEEYEGQVSEFLGEEARSRYGTESAWDDMRLGAAALIEAVLKRHQRE